MTVPFAAIAGRASRAEALHDALSSGSTLAVPLAARAPVLSALAKISSGRLLVITATEREAEALIDDLSLFLGEDPEDPKTRAPLLFPAWETLPFERISPEVGTMAARALVTDELRAGNSERMVLVAPVKALLQRLAPASSFRPIELRLGGELVMDEFVTALSEAGYRREYQVEHRGEFAVRGSIIDLFAPTSPLGVRIDLFGDRIDRLSWFDPGDQRSVEAIEHFTLPRCRELVLDDEIRERAAGLASTVTWASAQLEAIAAGSWFDGMEALLPWLEDDPALLADLLSADDRVLILDPSLVRSRALAIIEEEDALASSLAATWNAEDVEHAPRLHLPYDRLLARSPCLVTAMPSVSDSPKTVQVSTRGFSPVRGDGEQLVAQINTLRSRGMAVVLCPSTEAGAERLLEVLVEHDLEARLCTQASGKPGLEVVVAPLGQGAILPELGIALISESDLSGRRVAHRKARRRQRVEDGFFDSLHHGGFVVHRIHGVAAFEGVTSRTIAGATRDYLILSFRGGDRLFVPVDQIDSITPYSGGDAPSLSKMGGSDWHRASARARQAAAEVAAELVELYRNRLVVEGHAFGPDTPWQMELEEAFEFTETPDQLRAIAEVKADMELPTPMDRLVCADVGFGKTEIAVRAVFKAIQDGFQAAVLVPTTLLASQHFATFSERFAGFPVKVALLSRFLTTKEANAVRAGLESGEIDVVVATHRLLGSDINFAKLGLLVVDEEQRFGVSHKEQIKQVTNGVDVLTLTASPIPRTLEMALTGIRELSTVQTPPVDRQAILTYVGEYDDAVVVEAIRRELLREGQVFYVHNRVMDIDDAARRIHRLIPEARVAIAHGQMDEGTLEQIILDFAEGLFDVLVCTTIIESGIDMPSVNTLVVERADLLGLGQLHQIRGRVGRGGQRAYAYLFHPEQLSSERAYERLRTIGEQTELGSGFKIAMRDLEIRGAGSILGDHQSGHIAAVGYDLYVQLVAEAVAAAKGSPLPPPIDITIDVPGDAHLPEAYVEAEDLRLEGYRRLSLARDVAEIDALALEWVDRFGQLPPPAVALLDLAKLRLSCIAFGITSLSTSLARPGGARESTVRVVPVQLRSSREMRLKRTMPTARYRPETSQLVLPLPKGEGAAWVKASLEDLLADEPSADS